MDTMASMQKSAAWIRVKELIVSSAPIDEVKVALTDLNGLELESVFENGFNLMHFASMNNWSDVIDKIYETCESYYEQNVTVTVPYLAMACYLGFEDVLSVLLTVEPEKKVNVQDECWKRLVTEFTPQRGGWVR
jgi:hypothetical protein